MKRKYYQVMLNGEDIPGVRWAMRDTARFALEVEATRGFDMLRRTNPDKKYAIDHDPKWDWADIVYEKLTDYGEPTILLKSHVYSIREGEVGK